MPRQDKQKEFVVTKPVFFGLFTTEVFGPNSEPECLEYVDQRIGRGDYTKYDILPAKKRSSDTP